MTWISTLSEPARPCRRGFLAGGLAGAVALAAQKAQAEGPLDLSVPKGLLRAYMLMRGALDDRLVIGFVSGRYYGVVDAETRPLYGLAGATFSRYRARADGGFDGVGYELAFFTDLSTGAVLDVFHNPYTGETVEVPVTFLAPQPLIVQPNCDVLTPAAPPGLHVTDRIVSASVRGQDVWLTEETLGEFTPRAGAKVFRYNEILGLHARTSDFAAPGLKQAGCETAYASTVTWRPWLKMGDRPGHLMGVGAGRYGATMESLPETWRAAAAARRPDILNNPGALLASF